MTNITDGLGQYKKNKMLPDTNLGTALQRIRNICRVLISTDDRTLINNNIGYLRREIESYDLQRFGEKELPF